MYIRAGFIALPLSVHAVLTLLHSERPILVFLSAIGLNLRDFGEDF